MTTRIEFNGKAYASPDEMPAAVRKLYDAVMSQLADGDRDGIPDALAAQPGASIPSTHGRTWSAGTAPGRPRETGARLGVLAIGVLVTLLLLALWLAACEDGQGPVAGGSDLTLSIECTVCGVGTFTIGVGQNAQMTVRARSVTTGQEVACPSGSWSSAPTTVATVVGFAKAGTVTGVAPGTARVRVEIDCGSFGRGTAETNVLVSTGAPTDREVDGGA